MVAVVGGGFNGCASDLGIFAAVHFTPKNKNFLASIGMREICFYFKSRFNFILSINHIPVGKVGIVINVFEIYVVL